MKYALQMVGTILLLVGLAALAGVALHVVGSGCHKRNDVEYNE